MLFVWASGLVEVGKGLANVLVDHPVGFLACFRAVCDRFAAGALLGAWLKAVSTRSRHGGVDERGRKESIGCGVKKI